MQPICSLSHFAKWMTSELTSRRRWLRTSLVLVVTASPVVPQALFSVPSRGELRTLDATAAQCVPLPGFATAVTYLTRASDGALWAATEDRANLLLRYDPATQQSRFFGIPGLEWLHGLDFDPASPDHLFVLSWLSPPCGINLFVLDVGSVPSGGQPIVLSQQPAPSCVGCQEPNTLKFGPNGRLYTGGWGSDTLCEFDVSGTAVTPTGRSYSTPGFRQTGLAFDPSGSWIFVALFHATARSGGIERINLSDFSGSRLYSSGTSVFHDVTWIDGDLYATRNTLLPGWWGEIVVIDPANGAEIVTLCQTPNFIHDVVPWDLPPVANAGDDQTVFEGEVVILDGSASYDPGGQALSAQWFQIAGTHVELDPTDPLRPSFPAPSVPHGGETLTFELVVNDGSLDSEPELVNVTVKNVDHAPLADAGLDQTVAEASLVRLDGSASYDPDGDSISFLWNQDSGPTVTLSDPSSANPTFTAPFVGPVGETLRFSLVVSAGLFSVPDTVDVLVQNVNQTPIANAGADETYCEGSLVQLDGTASADADGDTLSFSWSQISGPLVSLSDSGSATPTFTAPAVGLGGATIVLGLTVNDGFLTSPLDAVTIIVCDTNDPPACQSARPNQAVLWPPNHKMVPITIAGVTDPNDDQVIITILSVTTDEPVNGLGDGDTGPDARIQGDRVLLRAERAGNGNGRVYVVSFRADDNQGASCTGSVTVTVPHNKKAVAVDDGQTHDATSQ